MHRTQLYLDEELVGRLRRLAMDEGTSMAELVRQAAWQLVRGRDDVEPWNKDDSIWRILGTEQGGGSDETSSHVDDYLYCGSDIELSRRSPGGEPTTT